MKFYFLEADQPVVKKYEKKGDEIIKTPYPMAYEFTSHEHIISGKLEELYELLQRHSGLGNTLVKGELNRLLSRESRAGATDPNSLTQWICLDLDGIQNYQSVDLFLQDLGLGNTSYILQWSSSMGIENQSGFRCHVFMLLDKPTHPQLLKHYLVYKNLTVSNLSGQLELTKTNNSLRYPLDISTCQNDKLIYIAPPKLVGINDPYNGSRIRLETRSRSTAILRDTIPNKDNLRDLVDKKINELREKANLPKKKATKYSYAGGTEYMANPERAIITEKKVERGFVYLNLNGGDSWGYYHPEDNPYFIFNFKGEPVYRTQDLLPDYWAELGELSISGNGKRSDISYLVFRDFKTSTYYNAIFDRKTGKLDYGMARNETQLRHFMEQHGQPMGEFVPDWNLVFDPDSNITVDYDNKILNTYQSSPYLRNEVDSKISTPPKRIHELISHVLGGEAKTVDAFYNWLACVVRFKDRTGTAWVLQGTQGTGKGLLYHRILSPLLGQSNVATRRMEELESQFTDFMENKFIVFIDEIERGRTLYHSKIVAKLKNLIVEPTISVRKMYVGAYESRNRANMIFASNKPDPVDIAPDDRRFNVGPYQTERYYISEQDLQELEKELPDFYSFLMNYPADRHRARYPQESEARNVLIDINRTSIDKVSDALLEGNLEFFLDQLLDKSGAASLSNPTVGLKYIPYKDLVTKIVNDPTTYEKLTREELNILFEWCVGEIPSNPGKFAALLKHHRIHLSPVWRDGKTYRGIKVIWKIKDQKWLENLKTQL
jgi:hypothetical protein